tara:strand:- start:1442 stop:2404 length:963 start_codon:yes stop_codon:yes gene_type:complete
VVRYTNEVNKKSACLFFRTRPVYIPNIPRAPAKSGNNVNQNLKMVLIFSYGKPTIELFCYDDYMNHLVIAVSPNSSLELLGKYADIILLDEQKNSQLVHPYKSVYIRSHFSRPDLMPQKFLNEIESLVEQAHHLNPHTTFVDGMSTVDEIVTFEDKWHQYQLFTELMPHTELLEQSNLASFVKPIFKNRLSSRGSGVTWNTPDGNQVKSEWIVQESIDIKEEIRIYVVNGTVHQTGTIRKSMTIGQKTQAIDSRPLTKDEIDFAFKVVSKVPELNMIGLDIARVRDGSLYLLEANRSPGFGAFEKLTRVNLATILYEGSL